MNSLVNKFRLASDFHIALDSVSVIVCLLAAILVFVLKLHTKVVYRLALYQVLSALALSFLSVIRYTYIKVDPDMIHDPACVAIGLFIYYTRWVILLFMTSVSIHLFCFAVCHKDLRKVEVLYVVTSLLMPGVVTCVPLITNTHAKVFWCYSNKSETYAIQRIVLWDAPAMFISLATLAAMIAMAIKLAHSVRWRAMMYGPIKEGDQHWKALKQLLPLVAFPIMFFVSTMPTLVFNMYNLYGHLSSTQTIAEKVLQPLWSLSAGVTLLIHIAVVKCSARKKGTVIISDNVLENTIELETSLIRHPCRPARNSTYYSLPPASV